jgi:hypothetical protein
MSPAAHATTTTQRTAKGTFVRVFDPLFRDRRGGFVGFIICQLYGSYIAVMTIGPIVAVMRESRVFHAATEGILR